MNKIQESFVKYYINKIEIRELTNEFKLNLIGVDIFDDPEKYFETKYELDRELKPNMRKYVNNYLRKMDYKKIKDNDKLI